MTAAAAKSAVAQVSNAIAPLCKAQLSNLATLAGGIQVAEPPAMPNGVPAPV